MGELTLYRVQGINWDMDGEDEDLPTSGYVNAESVDEISDILSEEYGFCIFSIDLVEPAGTICFM